MLCPIITVNKNVDRIIHFENSLIFAIFAACAINIYIGSVINMLLLQSAIFLVFITG